MLLTNDMHLHNGTIATVHIGKGKKTSPDGATPIHKAVTIGCDVNFRLYIGTFQLPRLAANRSRSHQWWHSYYSGNHSVFKLWKKETFIN